MTSPDAASLPDTDVGAVLLRASLSVAAAGAVFAVAMFFLDGTAAAFSCAIGGAIVALDTWALGKIVRALLSDDPGTRKGLWAAIGLAKLFVLFGGVWALLSYGIVSAPGLAAGIAALPAGLVATTLFPSRNPAKS